MVVVLLVSGCGQAVVTIPPLTSLKTVTTPLTWDSVASLPVGTVVELTGYCYVTNVFSVIDIQGDKELPDSYYLQPAANGGTKYLVFPKGNLPLMDSHLRVKVKIELADSKTLMWLGQSSYSRIIVLQELSRTELSN